MRLKFTTRAAHITHMFEGLKNFPFIKRQKLTENIEKKIKNVDEHVFFFEHALGFFDI